jgi:hypothetical protein
MENTGDDWEFLRQTFISAHSSLEVSKDIIQSFSAISQFPGISHRI